MIFSRRAHLDDLTHAETARHGPVAVPQDVGDGALYHRLPQVHVVGVPQVVRMEVRPVSPTIIRHISACNIARDDSVSVATRADRNSGSRGCGRRAEAAGTATHSFPATGITGYLVNGG